jgi:general stress protein 26
MTPESRTLIEELLRAHNILTLATLRDDGYPQATTVAYVHGGLTIYVGVSKQSQKVRNVERCNKVSLTIDGDEPDWSRIRGLSMAATAEQVTNADELQRVSTLMLQKFPQIRDLPASELANVAILRIVPKVISVLDYTKGFGHSELVEMACVTP